MALPGDTHYAPGAGVISRSKNQYWPVVAAQVPGLAKGRPPKRTPLSILQQPATQAYIFSEHFLAVSSHTPPALSQLALSVALVTSPAKAGPVKASASANANIEISAFMDITPLVARGVPKELRLTARVPRLKSAGCGKVGRPWRSPARSISTTTSQLRLMATARFGPYQLSFEAHPSASFLYAQIRANLFDLAPRFWIGNPRNLYRLSLVCVVNCSSGGIRDHEPLVCSNIAALLTRLSA